MERKFGWVPESSCINNNFLSQNSSNNKQHITYELDIGTEIFDQGSLGSCTSNAIISALAYLKKKVNFRIVDYIFITNKGN